MIVLTSFKPFRDRVGLIQMRAIENWKKTFPGARIVDFQHETRTPVEGVERLVVEGVVGHPPTFNAIADWTAQNCRGEVCLYLNADILFEKFEGSEKFEEFEKHLPEGNFLGIGQRIDALSEGGLRLHRPSGMDYFFFRAGMFADLPQTIVGRAYYDCALVAWCLRRDVKVVDLTTVVSVIHQWHNYLHVPCGRREVFEGPEAQANKANNELEDFGPHIADAPYAMTTDGKIIPNPKRSWLRQHGYWKLWNILTRGGKSW